jgi:hypothetical protein
MKRNKWAGKLNANAWSQMIDGARPSDQACITGKDILFAGENQGLVIAAGGNRQSAGRNSETGMGGRRRDGRSSLLKCQSGEAALRALEAAGVQVNVVSLQTR